MSQLRDALAAALLREYGDRDEVTDELIPDQYDQQDSADAILSDPAFREALVEAVAEAMQPVGDCDRWTVWIAEDSRTIVARMLGAEA